MKVIFVLCLLAFMSCQKDIMDIAKCLYESPKVKELIGDIMVAIVTKDFSKLWDKIKDSIPELIQVVLKCVTGGDEANLQAMTCAQCLATCRLKKVGDACLPCLRICRNIIHEKKE